MRTEIYLNREELASLLPVLERILSAVATEKMRPPYVGTKNPFEKTVYVERCFDEEMFGNVLSCRNKLKSIGSSRKLRMNCFQLAALGLAARVALKDASRLNRTSRTLLRLPRKLEMVRKRAKRAWVLRQGKESFTAASCRWKHFVQWLRFKVLAPPNRRERPLTCVLANYREQRQYMRRLAGIIALPTADTKELEHLADLGKAEVRRGRHPFTMHQLMADQATAQQFLAHFILNRKGPDVLKSEFLPLVLQKSRRAKGFQAALTITTPDPKLQAVLANWIKKEVDPGYFEAVRDEIKYQLLSFEHLHHVPVRATGVKSIIEACRPDDDEEIDIRSFFGVWAARFLLALQPSKDGTLKVVFPAFLQAEEWWQKLTPLTRQRKLNEISARYFK